MFSVRREVQKRFWEEPKERRGWWHPVVESFARPKAEIIRKLLLDQGIIIPKVLDVGCGDGYFSWIFKGWGDVVGVDFSKAMLLKNRLSNKLKADALSLPFKDSSFDLVFCSNLLHHVESPLEVVREMKRVSRRFVAVSEPNSLNPVMFSFGLVRREERGTLKFNRFYLRKLFKTAGLKITLLVEQGSILPNKTPHWLFPFFRLVDGKYIFGFYTIIVGEKS